MKKHIAVIPGDGIGPEITRQAVTVLEAAASRFGHEFEFEYVDCGGAAIDKYGVPLTEGGLEACRRSDSVLLGAVGGPKWAGMAKERRPEAALLALRSELGLYANMRPAKLYPQLAGACPLKERVVSKGVDLLICRELTGDVYFGEHKTEKRGGLLRAEDVMGYDENEVRRIARRAFEAARRRRGRVTSVDKANVLDTSRLWRSVVTETGREYPDVELEHMYVDNAAMQLVSAPSRFDVILTSNLFGDILSDEASMVTGSIGMLPSSSMGGGSFGMFEPIHGSAPDIAGRDEANPIGTILAAAMMLRYAFGMEPEASAVEKAVEAALDAGLRTSDIAFPGEARVSCSEMGRAVAGGV